MKSKARLAIWTSQRVRGHVGHDNLTLAAWSFSPDGTYRATYVDSRDVVDGCGARWDVTSAPGLGIIDIRRQARAHSQV
jgi:hypothetical protein